MEYRNKKIDQLIRERDEKISELNREIEREILKEKAKYKFSWKRFILIICGILFMFLAVNLNKKIFPKTSIFSWEYYGF